MDSTLARLSVTVQNEQVHKLVSSGNWWLGSVKAREDNNANVFDFKMALKCDGLGRVDRRGQTTLSSFLPFIDSVELKDLKCANAKYDIKQAGISAQVSRFAVVSLIVSIPGCQFMAFQMPFCGRRAFSRQMHTAVIYLFIYVHCCRDGLGDSYFSARIRACV